jgi:hypothetical protein
MATEATLAMMVAPSIHVHIARNQLATVHAVDIGNDVLICTMRPRQLVWCIMCKQRRRASNCIVHVYYDGSYFFCRKGKGCKS